MLYRKTKLVLSIVGVMLFAMQCYAADYEFSPIDIPDEITGDVYITSVSPNGKYLGGVVWRDEGASKQFMFRYSEINGFEALRRDAYSPDVMSINNSGQLLGSYEPLEPGQPFYLAEGCKAVVVEPDGEERLLQYDQEGSCWMDGHITDLGEGVFVSQSNYNPVVKRFDNFDTLPLYQIPELSNFDSGALMSMDGDVAAIETLYRDIPGKRRRRRIIRLYRLKTNGKARMLRRGRGLRRAEDISLVGIDGDNTAYYLLDVSKRNKYRYRLVSSSGLKLRAQQKSRKFEGDYTIFPLGMSEKGDLLVDYAATRTSAGNVLGGSALVNIEQNTPEILRCNISNDSKFQDFYGKGITNDGRVVGGSQLKDDSLIDVPGVLIPDNNSGRKLNSYCIGAVTVKKQAGCTDLSIQRNYGNDDEDYVFELFKVRATGNATCNLIVTVYDAFGNPVQGGAVTFQRPYEEEILSSAVTDENGKAIIQYPLGEAVDDDGHSHYDFDKDLVLTTPVDHPTIQPYKIFFDER